MKSCAEKKVSQQQQQQIYQLSASRMQFPLQSPKIFDGNNEESRREEEEEEEDVVKNKLHPAAALFFPALRSHSSWDPLKGREP